jgi:hypothetical protein
LHGCVGARAGPGPSPRARFREISHTLAAVSSSSSFWSSLTENPLYVDVAGWRFKYTIDRERKEFDVLEIIRVSGVVLAASRTIGQRKRQA